MKELPDKVDSKYLFVSIAAKRCDMLQKGAKPKVDHSNMMKYTSVAMEELSSNKLEFFHPEEVISGKADEILEAAEAERAAEEAARAEETAEESTEPQEE
jgi:DNA-directed RNA polymerase omega subunit